MVAGVELRLVKAEIFQLYRISKYSNYQLIECLFYAIIDSTENTSKLQKHRNTIIMRMRNPQYGMDVPSTGDGNFLNFSIFRVDVDLGRVSPPV